MLNIALLGGIILVTGVLAALVYRKPFGVPSLMAVGIPFHLAVLIVIYHFFGFPAASMNIIASWKELLVLWTLLFMVLYSLQKKNWYRFTPNTVDAVIALYLGFNLVYLFCSLTIFPHDSGIAAVFNGFRMQAMMAIAYVAARLATKRSKGNIDKYLKLLVVVGTMVSILGIAEIFINPLPVLNKLGMKEYLIDVGGMKEQEFAPEGGVLTYFSNFTTQNGESVRWRRSASLFLSPLGFAQVLLITIPIALILLLQKKIPARHLILQISGLLSSISRGPTIAIAVGCFGILAFINYGISRKQKRWITFFLCVIGAGILYEGMDLINATIGGRELSAISRAGTYLYSLQFMREHPFGAGLAVSDTKFVKGEIIGGGESEYFENVSRIGWIGLALYLAMHCIFLKRSLRGAKDSSLALSTLSAIVFAITLTLFTQEFVNRIWKNPFLPYAYGWIVGAWATLVADRKKALLDKA